VYQTLILYHRTKVRPSYFSLVVSIGPGDFEIERLRAVIDALSKVEPKAVSAVVILDDARVSRDFSFVNGAFGRDVLELIKSPRDFSGDHWRGGLTVNYLAGLERAFAVRDVDFAMVIDSDALPLRSFSHRVGNAFAINPELGVLGSGVVCHPDGKPRGLCTWDRQLKKWRKLVRMRREPFPRVESAFGGKNAHIRSVFLQAFPNGDEDIVYPQGGAFAVSRAFISAYEQKGYSNSHRAWLHTDMPYDVAFGVLNMALGLQAQDDNGVGGVFGVAYRGLPFQPELLVEREYAWVHSLKSESAEMERGQRGLLIKRCGLSS
jgi:hypothetical protein